MTRPALVLGAILIAITAVNYTAEAIAAAWVVSKGWPLWAAVVGMAILILTLAEAIPIFYAAANPERVARAVALPVWLASWILIVPARLFGLIAEGLTRLLGGKLPPQAPVTEGEIRAIVDLQTEAGGLEAEEKVMIHSIFEFGDTVAARSDGAAHRHDRHSPDRHDLGGRPRHHRPPALATSRLRA